MSRDYNVAMAGGDDNSDSGNGDWGSSWEGDSDVATESEKKLARPRMYRVLLHNDDYTTMEFVVHVLKSVFNHKDEEAVQIMLHVHQSGIGIAGVFSFEIAETKIQKTTDLARESEFPLRCSMERE